MDSFTWKSTSTSSDKLVYPKKVFELDVEFDYSYRTEEKAFNKASREL